MQSVSQFVLLRKGEKKKEKKEAPYIASGNVNAVYDRHPMVM